jgi:hypothetical protein
MESVTCGAATWTGSTSAAMATVTCSCGRGGSCGGSCAWTRASFGLTEYSPQRYPGWTGRYVAGVHAYMNDKLISTRGVAKVNFLSITLSHKMGGACAHG